jgi:histidine triad (HIT) family protein
MACIFCKIIEGSLPAEILYRDDQVIAFKDIHPIAPVHFLVVPITHLNSLNESQPEHEILIGHMTCIARQLAEEAGIHQSGYRLVINTGPDAGQSVFHLHLHVLGGRHLPFRFE